MAAPVPIATWCAFALAVAADWLVPADRLPARLANDKLLHLLSYTALLVAALASTLRQTAAGATILLLAGLLIQLVQHVVQGRSFCTRNLMANAAGVLIGTLLGLVVAS